MPISFDNIPQALRTPGAYIEFNNELSGAGGIDQKMLIIGQRFSTGSIAEGVPTRVTKESDAIGYFGNGSQLAEMLIHAMAINRDTELWAIALDDPAAGAFNTQVLNVTGTASQAGALNLYIDGKRVQLGVLKNQDAVTVAANIVALINAKPDLSVTASVAVNAVTLTSKHKGAAGIFSYAANYYMGEGFPAGITVAESAAVESTVNPDVLTAISAMSDEWYNWMVMPFTDPANLGALAVELESRWGPMRQIGGRAFTAFKGTHAESGVFGSTLNSPHLTCMAVGAAPQPAHIWAAVYGARSAKSLGIDPARPLQTLTLCGLLPPKKAAIWTREERNLLLYDGLATYTVGTGGCQIRIERAITTYQTNAAGLLDASYLDINTPETLERLRYSQRQRILQKFPRHKLASDGTAYGAGQAIVTPNIIKAELLALYREMESKGWVEDFEHYRDSMIVEINADDKNRIDVNDQPNLVNQFRVHAQKTQFII